MNTESLLTQSVWDAKAYQEEESAAERVGISYRRARSLVRHLGMTTDDIVNLGQKFRDFHSDYVVSADTATATILTIHWNLCMGTIASYAAHRPELQPVLAELARFDSCGEFMLTEVGHGLDARNIETTATMNLDGSFDLHTPHLRAAKIMPPTTVRAGVPRIAVVFARLVVAGGKGTIRPFVVRINSKDRIAHGITSRPLPARPGAKDLDHAVTMFNHVRLEPSSLLGELAEPESARKEFARQIHRVSVGTLFLSMTNIPCLRLSAYVLGRYSQYRRVGGGKSGEGVPIVIFSTQHTPVLTSLTFSSVFEAYSEEACNVFAARRDEPEVQSALACVFKQTTTHWTQSLMNEMVDRCGWQGLYRHNQLSEMTLALRGNSIAEGDTLVLCIRLVSELLQGRYAVPEPRDTSSLLARYEAGVWEEASQAVGDTLASGQHRNDDFNARVLPRCRALVQATGQRMAYEAALASKKVKVSPEMLKLYEATCVLNDPSWFVQHAGLSRGDIFNGHSAAVRALLPSLERILQETNAEPWASAPFLTEQRWEDFVARLPAYGTVAVAPQSGQVQAHL